MEAKESLSVNSNSERLRCVADLVEIAGRMKSSTVVIAGGYRIDDLRLVESARDHGIIDRIILVGNKDRINRSVSKCGIEIRPKDVVSADSPESVAESTVELIKSGQVDIVLKGNISTPVINRYMLPLADRSTVSLATIFDAEPIAESRPMILTDAGVTTVCNFGRMVGLVTNALDVARVVMKISKPRVAILSANEKQIPSLPSTWIGQLLSKRHWPNAVVYGPLSFDLAVNPESVAVKGLPDLPSAREVAGQADILVCPGIDSANILYKTISEMSKYGEASLAGITVGFPVPYIILSRADSLTTRLDSIALCSIYAQRKLQAKRKRKTVSGKVKDKSILCIKPSQKTVKVSVYTGSGCLYKEHFQNRLSSVATEVELVKEIKSLSQKICRWLGQNERKKVHAVSVPCSLKAQKAKKAQENIIQITKIKNGRTMLDYNLITQSLNFKDKNFMKNVGLPLAADSAETLNIPAFAVNFVQEIQYAPESEVSGYSSIVLQGTLPMISISSAVKKAAQIVGRPAEDINLVVSVLGETHTVVAVIRNQITDSTITPLGSGPFSLRQTGQLPMKDLIELCFSGKFSHAQILEELSQRGGLYSYLKEDCLEIIEKKIKDGDGEAELILEAMIYQISKEIGKMFVAAGCDVEAIVLSGEMLSSKQVKTSLRRLTGRLAPVLIFDGDIEMELLSDTVSARI